MTSRAGRDDHPHHWLIAPLAVNGRYPARCRRCGKRAFFPIDPPPRQDETPQERQARREFLFWQQMLDRIEGESGRAGISLKRFRRRTD